MLAGGPGPRTRPRWGDRRAHLPLAGETGGRRQPLGQAVAQHAERWGGTVRVECLDWLLIVGRRHLEQVLRVYVQHDNQHRPHGGSNAQRSTRTRLFLETARYVIV
jgi:hypothetical protein